MLPASCSSIHGSVDSKVLVTVALLAGLVASVATIGAQRLLPSRPATGLDNRAVTAAAAPSTPGSAQTGAAEPQAAADLPLADRADELEMLRTALVEAEAERSQLAATLVSLTRDVDGLVTAVGAMNLPSGDAPASGFGGEHGLPSDDSTGTNGGSGFGRDGPSGNRRLDNLVAAGVDPDAAAALQRRADEFQLARLELADQAAREGWTDSELFEERLDELDATEPDLRSELGDDAYDRYLFESGSMNRVGIASIIPGSAAATAGLEPGDIVYSYSTERVFRMSDLQAATRAGARGEYVPVTVIRAGQLVALELPRGPLGVTLSRDRAEP